MNIRRKIDYSKLLPDYANYYIDNDKYNYLKAISEYYRKKLEEKSNNKTEYFNNVSRLMSGITFSNIVNPEERKIIIANLICSDDDIQSVMLEEENSDLLATLTIFFESVKIIKKKKINRIEINEQDHNNSFTEYYKDLIAKCFSKYWNVQPGSIDAEAIINKINCIYTYHAKSHFFDIFSDKQKKTRQ